MTKRFQSFLSVVTLLHFGCAVRAFAHGDHSAPGAIPPAPHGGFVAELAGKKHDHEHGEEKEHAHDHGHEGESGHKHADEHKNGAAEAHDHDSKESGHDHGHEEKKESDKSKPSQAHKETEEREVFVEVILKGEEVRVFPLTMGKEGSKMFVPFPLADLKDSELTIEFPRSKKTHSVSMKANDTYWSAVLPKNRDRRFFAILSAKHAGEKKTAKVQVEKKQG